MNKKLDLLLQIEDDQQLFEYICTSTGILIWPLIRVRVMREVMGVWFSPKAFTAQFSNINYLKLIIGGAVSEVRDLRYIQQHSRKILIQSTGFGQYDREGVLHNRLTDYFADSMPDQTLIWQDKPMSRFFSAHQFNPTIHKTIRNISYWIYSRMAISNVHRKLANLVIKRVSDNVENKLGFKFDANQIIGLSTLLAQRLAGLPYISDAYANWFSTRSFKLLLKEDACYGGSSLPIIYAARLNDMVIAEYQHGAILRGHDAYNVSDSLANYAPYKNTLPDYLLTYGKWWASQTNMPIKKIPIGNPHMAESLNSKIPLLSKKEQILVLGDGFETEAYLNLVKNISKLANRIGMTVVFRPHPLERQTVNSSSLPRGVFLDLHENIYTSLRESRIVVSELSTGLFEAVGLVDMVVLWNTKRATFAFPDGLPFSSFSTIEELESILDNSDSIQKDLNLIAPSDIWEPHWKQNYLRFVRGVLRQ
jgi:hypothetical protein